MSEGLPIDFQILQQQIAALEEHSENPSQLKEALLAAMSSLIGVLDSFESGRLDGDPVAPRVDKILVQSFRKVLKALERSQNELRESEERYRAIVESQTNLLCRFLPDGTLTYVNDYFAVSLNLPREKLLNRSFYNYFVENTRNELPQKIRKLTSHNPVLNFEHAYKTPDGKIHWHQWTCRGIFDSQGVQLEVQAVGYDISAIKMAELTTAQHNRELSALHTATTALLSTLDSEKLLGQILDAAIVAIPVAKKGAIHLIALDTGQLELRATIGYGDPRIKKFVYGESTGYVARSVRERRPLIVHDARNDLPLPKTGTISETTTINSAIVAPLALDNRILGAISLESIHRAAFKDSDLRLLVSFAATATNAIRNTELHAQVQKLAITDALTGLFNRRGFDELGEREVERSFRFKRPLTAILIDVDNFKRVNDAYGHAVGDQVLRSIAGLISNQLRKIDILGRYGGDEFIVLLPETHIRVGSKVAERLRITAEESFVPTENDLVRVSISVGVTGLNMEMANLEALINQADAAMYAAKDAGRNCVVTI